MGHFGGVADAKPCSESVWNLRRVGTIPSWPFLDHSTPEFSEKGIRGDGQHLQGNLDQREDFCKNIFRKIAASMHPDANGPVEGKLDSTGGQGEKCRRKGSVRERRGNTSHSAT